MPLLIDEAKFHGEVVQHWVALHSVRREIGLIQDPRVDAERGETWGDPHDPPVTKLDLDVITGCGDPAYRGVIVLRPVG